VTRNIANQFHPTDDSAISVITYGVGPLEIRQIAVVGHTKCGGVKACLEAARDPATSGGVQGPLQRWLEPLTDLARDPRIESIKDFDEASVALTELNVKKQVENIVQSDVIQKAWADKKDVQVHGWIYHVESGGLRDLYVSKARPDH